MCARCPNRCTNRQPRRCNFMASLCDRYCGNSRHKHSNSCMRFNYSHLPRLLPRRQRSSAQRQHNSNSCSISESLPLLRISTTHHRKLAPLPYHRLRTSNIHSNNNSSKQSRIPTRIFRSNTRCIRRSMKCCNTGSSKRISKPNSNNHKRRCSSNTTSSTLQCRSLHSLIRAVCAAFEPADNQYLMRLQRLLSSRWRQQEFSRNHSNPSRLLSSNNSHRKRSQPSLLLRLFLHRHPRSSLNVRELLTISN